MFALCQTNIKLMTEGIYFVTLTTVDWVDVFTRRELKITIIDSLKYCQNNKGLIIYAWCLMHSHLHMIVGTKVGFDLSAILRDMKKHTAKEIIKNRYRRLVVPYFSTFASGKSG